MTVALFPFGLGWRVPASILVGTCSTLHHRVSMHALSVGHHAIVATGVRKHLVLASVCCIVHHAVLLLSVVCLLSATLSLTLDIHRRMRSDSVLRRSRAWFLRASSLFSHHLIVHMCTLASGATNQVVMLLH